MIKDYIILALKKDCVVVATSSDWSSVNYYDPFILLYVQPNIYKYVQYL